MTPERCLSPDSKDDTIVTLTFRADEGTLLRKLVDKVLG